jgi:hypothetical protein
MGFKSGVQYRDILTPEEGSESALSHKEGADSRERNTAGKSGSGNPE